MEGYPDLCRERHTAGSHRWFCAWAHEPVALPERLGEADSGEFIGSGGGMGEGAYSIQRLPAIVRDAWGIVSGVLVYILVGIGIGAFMHGFVPEGFFEQYMSKDNWYAVPLSVVLAVPMYANAAGIVPVIEVFVAKGVPMGTAIAFMMAVVGLSLPEATLLKKVMTWKLIGIFFGTVAFFIILSGYLFNYLL